MQWDGEHVQANTFITDGMYSEKQSEMLSQAEDAKQEQKEIQEFINILRDMKNQEGNTLNH